MRSFDTFCYATNGQPEQVARIAAAMKLERAPAELVELMSSGKGDQATAWVIEVDPAANRLMVVGAGNNGTCSVYAGGYGVDRIEASMRKEFELFRIGGESVGLQETSAYVPGGKSNMVSELHANGLVSIIRSKPDAGGEDEIMIGFVPPALAREAVR